MATLLDRPDPRPGPAPAPAGTVPGDAEGARRPSLTERFRWVTVCVAFLALTLSQQPGKVLTDTKLDLTADPWGFLGRALQLWEPEGFAGQVQNQAYGYLFPMGPFFAVLQSAGLPGWVVQRLWMAALLSVAFLGALTLARRLGIGGPAAQLIGGLAYALAPRMLMGLGATSIEVLPMAVAPWVLVPLVTGARGGSPRRAAARSGLAVFCVGGVNAVATSAVLPLAALYLLTRPAGPRRRRLIGWWAAAVALATAWWVGPLLLLRRFSPPFLDYIETAGNTTVTTGLLSTLRGTTQWVAYLADGSGPLWPTGWSLVHDVVPALATVLLAAAGLVGLTRRTMPERSWLVLGLLTGLALVTMGHLATVEGLFAEPLHAALDGVLAPLRNVHKYDPVLRLPLALGIAHLCGLLLARRGRDGAGQAGPRPRGGGEPGGAPAGGLPSRASVTRVLARTGVGVVAVALVATASPAIAGRLSPPTGYEAVPEYWRETADFLAAERPDGRALLLPASSSGTYFWGSTSDEPLQALADSPWTVRNAIPLSSTGHIRLLDAVEAQLARGEPSAGLAGYLARAGISHLVVRNDLDFGAVDATRTILVRQALRNSPGFRQVAGFGPLVPSDTELFGRALDHYLIPPQQAVVVYAVADPAPRASATPLSDTVSVVGGPDGILALADRGLLTDRPALLPDGDGHSTGTTMVSDAQVRRERNFGRIADAVSQALAPGEPRRLDGPQLDYSYPGAELSETHVRYEGGRVSASSSAADADALGGARPADQPFAALDGDPATAWRPARWLAPSQQVWWRVESDRPLAAREITVRLAETDGTPPTMLRVTTDAGSRVVRVADTTEPQVLPLPVGATSVVTLEVPGPTTRSLALAEVEVPGLRIERTLVTPPADEPVAVYAFDATNPATSGCVEEAGGTTRCAATLVRPAEEGGGLDRTFTVGQAAGFDLAAVAVPRPGPALDALIGTAARPAGPEVTVTSAVVPDPRAGGDAAVDGDPRTTWVAAADDGRPALTLTWPEPRTIDRVRVGLLPGTAASAAMAVAIDDGGLEQTVTLDEEGVAEFAPLTTDRLTVTFLLRQERESFDPYQRRVEPLGVGVTELAVDGVAEGDADTVVELPCGAGPTVAVDGVVRETSLRTTLGDLRSLRPVPLGICSGDASTGELAAGEHRLVARGTDVFTVRSATLTRSGAELGEPGRRTEVQVERWDREDRVVRIAARDEAALLVVPESTNPGWVATLGGRELETRTVDGWQQGYVVPAGAADEVVLHFRAGTIYHTALAAGAAALLGLAVLLLLPARGAGPPPTGTRGGVGLGVALAAVAGVAVVGGPWGLVALAGAVVAGARVRRRQLVFGRLAGGALGAAGLVHVTLTGGAAQLAVQVLALLAVVAVVAALLVTAGATGSWTRVRHRLAGRSTSR